MKAFEFWTKYPSRRWAVGLAALGPLGWLGPAPGTNGSLAGILCFFSCFNFLSIYWQAALLAVFIGIAIIVCGAAEKAIGVKDPKEVILDEFAAMPLCFFGLNQYQEFKHNAWFYLALGFVIFRIIDIFKPFGIKRIQKMPGGLGIVLDDLAAAILTCLILHLLF